MGAHTWALMRARTPSDSTSLSMGARTRIIHIAAGERERERERDVIKATWQPTETTTMALQSKPDSAYSTYQAREPEKQHDQERATRHTARRPAHEPEPYE